MERHLCLCAFERELFCSLTAFLLCVFVWRKKPLHRIAKKEVRFSFKNQMTEASHACVACGRRTGGDSHRRGYADIWPRANITLSANGGCSAAPVCAVGGFCRLSESCRFDHEPTNKPFQGLKTRRYSYIIIAYINGKDEVSAVTRPKRSCDAI